MHGRWDVATAGCSMFWQQQHNIMPYSLVLSLLVPFTAQDVCSDRSLDWPQLVSVALIGSDTKTPCMDSSLHRALENPYNPVYIQCAQPCTHIPQYIIITIIQ